MVYEHVERLYISMHDSLRMNVIQTLYWIWST